MWILVSLFDKVSHPQIKYYGLNFAYTKKETHWYLNLIIKDNHN